MIENLHKFDIETIRSQFPIFKAKVCGQNIAYLDNGASSQKPLAMIQRLQNFYGHENANVHRGIYYLSEMATKNYEAVRDQVRTFLNASNDYEVINTRGTTESINIVADSWAKGRMNLKSAVLTTRLEHHSNFVPWQRLSQNRNCEFRIAEITSDGFVDLDDLRLKLKGAGVLAITHMSNVLGSLAPLTEVMQLANDEGVPVVLDCAQSVPHFELDLSGAAQPDFIAFSAHKTCGPTGVGFLLVKKSRIEEFDPYQYGGDMIESVGDFETTWNKAPWKLEAGTPNFADVIAFGASLDFLESLNRDELKKYEKHLSSILLDELLAVPGLQLMGSPTMNDRGPVFSFLIDGIHSHDLATFLDRDGVCIRAGHHCAQPLLRSLDVKSICRASLAFYNNEEDVRRLTLGLYKARKYFL